MNLSRVPTLTALFLALLLGAAPWRVCAHGGHGGVWVPGTHAHGSGEGPGACATSAHVRRPAGHAAPVRGRAACAHSHAHHGHGGCGHRCAPHRHHATPDQPQPERSEHCHCDDQPLLARTLALPVQVEAPRFAGWLEFAPLPSTSVGAQEVARSDLAGVRIAHEQDPIVLLR